MRLSVPFSYKETAGRSIEGHGSIFGNVDQGGDIVLPGAFKQSLANHRSAGTMPAMLYQHDHKQVPGVWKEAREDSQGLFLKGELLDTQLGRETREQLKHQAIRGLSIGFQLQEFDFDDDGNRLIKSADLWETSVVTFPMNREAIVTAVKSLYQPRELETDLRDAGFSRSWAKKTVSELYSSEPLRDAEPDAIQKLLNASSEYEHKRQMRKIFS